MSTKMKRTRQCKPVVNYLSPESLAALAFLEGNNNQGQRDPMSVDCVAARAWHWIPHECEDTP